MPAGQVESEGCTTHAHIFSAIKKCFRDFRSVSFIYNNLDKHTNAQQTYSYKWWGQVEGDLSNLS